MNTIRILSAGIVFALMLAACSSPDAGSTPGVTLFSDDFSNMDGKWNQTNDSTRTTDYFNGAYRIVINEPDYVIWSTPEGQSFTDIRIEADAMKNGGPEDNDFGVICRYIDENQFYYAAISSDGYYGILKMTGTGGMLIGEDSLLESNKINQGSKSNHVRFDCIGSTLTLYVNGSKVDQQSDSEYTVGNVGFIAGTYKTSGTDILFDNLMVFKP